MKPVHALALMSAVGITLAGCGNADIESTKSAVLPQEPTHTYGTALSNRESCEKDEWRSVKDEANRTVVEYRCVLKNGGNLLAAFREQKIKEIKQEYQGYYRGLDQSIEDTKAAPAIAAKRSAEAERELARAQELQTSANAGLAPEDPAQALRRAAVQNEMGAVASARFTAERAAEGLNGATENLDKNLASLQQERARFEQAEKEALANIDKTYGGVTKVSEVFRWHVNGKDAVPATAQVEFEKQDGGVTSLNKEWKATMRDLLHARGEAHVRYLLNVTGSAVAGQ